jgi:hypothetical protein
MRRAILCCLAMLPSFATMAAEQSHDPKSVCAIAGKLLSTCPPGKAAANPDTEVSLDFSIDGPERKVVASLADTTAKTGVIVPAERLVRKRAPRVEASQSEWCNPKKD